MTTREMYLWAKLAVLTVFIALSLVVAALAAVNAIAAIADA
jgi:hypothetical protein